MRLLAALIVLIIWHSEENNICEALVRRLTLARLERVQHFSDEVVLFVLRRLCQVLAEYLLRFHLFLDYFFVG